MKLLFDENLSPKLPRLLAALFPDSVHVRDCNLKGASDEAIWDFARTHAFTLVSKDSDFYQRSLLHGHPPRLVWIGIGNCDRRQLVALLTSRASDILRLASESAESVLILIPPSPSA